MLLLLRRKDQGLTITTPEGPIRIVICGADVGRVILGIEAPKNYAIHRDEAKTKGF